MDLITEATKEKIHIVEMHNKDSEHGILCNLTFKVKNRNEINHLINSLSRYKYIKVVN